MGKLLLTVSEGLPMQGFLALSDPTRRQIFEGLAKRPRSVGELAAKLPVSRPAVSQHLKILKEAGPWGIYPPSFEESQKDESR